VHAGQLAVVRLSDVNVQALALVNEGGTVSGHLDNVLLRDLPHGAVEQLQLVRDLVDILRIRRFSSFLYCNRLFALTHFGYLCHMGQILIALKFETIFSVLMTELAFFSIIKKKFCLLQKNDQKNLRTLRTNFR